MCERLELFEFLKVFWVFELNFDLRGSQRSCKRSEVWFSRIFGFESGFVSGFESGFESDFGCDSENFGNFENLDNFGNFENFGCYFECFVWFSFDN